MAAEIIASMDYFHTHWLKLPSFGKPRLQSSSSSIGIQSPCSVLPQNPKPTKKRPLSPEPEPPAVKTKRIKLVEAQQREADVERQRREREADLERKRREEQAEKDRLERIRRQRIAERLARERLEAAAESRVQKPYCCTLKDLGLTTTCDCSWSSCCWEGQQIPLPLKQLGFFSRRRDPLLIVH